ncbi:unnamed protein product, partial [Aphanomyces euteiches]
MCLPLQHMAKVRLGQRPLLSSPLLRQLKACLPHVRRTRPLFPRIRIWEVMPDTAAHKFGMRRLSRTRRPSKDQRRPSGDNSCASTSGTCQRSMRYRARAHARSLCLLVPVWTRRPSGASHCLTSTKITT